MTYLPIPLPEDMLVASLGKFGFWIFFEGKVDSLQKFGYFHSSDSGENTQVLGQCNWRMEFTFPLVQGQWGGSTAWWQQPSLADLSCLPGWVHVLWAQLQLVGAVNILILQTENKACSRPWWPCSYRVPESIHIQKLGSHELTPQAWATHSAGRTDVCGYVRLKIRPQTKP